MSTKLEAYRKVCVLAGTAVLESSPTGKRTAYVRRDLLNRIEAALIEAGFDIPTARAKLDAESKVERKNDRAKRDAEAVAKYPVGTCVELYRRRHPSIPAAPYDIGFVVEPDGTSKRKRKSDEVYVRWNIPGEPRSWISAYDLGAAR